MSVWAQVGELLGAAVAGSVAHQLAGLPAERRRRREIDAEHRLAAAMDEADFRRYVIENLRHLRNNAAGAEAAVKALYPDLREDQGPDPIWDRYRKDHR